ncbi:MAG: type II and III secretion system protein [Desulfurivibrionaceae bacterium]
MNSRKDFMRKSYILQIQALIAVLLIFTSCAGQQSSSLEDPDDKADRFIAKHKEDTESKAGKKSGQLPERFQKADFSIEDKVESDVEEVDIPVGVDIRSDHPVSLRKIMKKLVQLKGMNVSWANDVDQGALVDVDIRAGDNFFQSIENLLGQLDYFHEIKGNSILVKHKDTQVFHVAMPFTKDDYSSGAGGDVLGGSGGSEHELTGTIQLTSEQESEGSFNIWSNIRDNLDQILEIWTKKVETTDDSAGQQGEGEENGTSVTTNRQPGKGYYTIDRPVGLVTVTAPKSLLEKVENYFDQLKNQVYRQISIEAKIVEVTLSEDNRTGINWEDLLQNNSNPLSFSMDFQKLNPSYQGDGTQNRFLTLDTHNFGLIIDAMKDQGHVEVLANPRVSVMNGQPSLISIGENKTFIDKVEATQEEGVVTYSVTTNKVMSGLGMGVVATIHDNNEVMLKMTPVTSKVKEPIEYRQFGQEGSEVGLPQVAIRELTSIVKVENGRMLVVGGLIDSRNEYGNNRVSWLHSIPVLGKLFRQDGMNKERKELVILLRPKII